MVQCTSKAIPRPALAVVALAIGLTGGCAGDISSAPDTRDGSTANAVRCGPTTCKGCCNGGQCVAGTTGQACGRYGLPCVECASGQTCHNRVCSSGKCSKATCNGCCDGDACREGTSNSACGGKGAACANCSAQKKKCDLASRSCKGSCTPDCKGKCKGAADGCGGKCQTSSCSGCCKGTKCELGSADTACGKNGAPCADCGATSKICKSGLCSGCTPSCSGKCKGATDGCGSTCSTNACTGCCDSTTCRPGTSDTKCGKSGENCWKCPSDFQGYKWTCSSQKCIQSTPVSCAGKTGGTDSCVDSNAKSGKCWNESCCIGCWSGSYCFRYINGYDTTCGNGGVQCADCTTLGKACVNFTCQ